MNQPTVFTLMLSHHLLQKSGVAMLLPKKAETIHDLCLDAWKQEEPFYAANQCQPNKEQWLVIQSTVKKSDVWCVLILLQMSLSSQDEFMLDEFMLALFSKLPR